MADIIFTGLHLTGMACGGILGYNNGNILKDYAMKNKQLSPYLNKFLNKKSTYLNDELLFRLIASGTGIIIGRIAWPITIPYLLYTL